MATERALHLPALPVTSEIVRSPHLSSVLGLRPAVRAVRDLASGNDCRANPEFFATELVKVLRVVGLVSEEAMDRMIRSSLRHCRDELGGIVRRTERRLGSKPQMSSQIANRRELWESDRADTNALPPLVVAADVAGLKASSVDGDATSLGKQLENSRQLDHSSKQEAKGPPL